MIVNKKDKNAKNNEKAKATEQAITQTPVEVPVQVEANGPIDVLNAIMDILRGVTWEYGVPNSPKIFNTVQIDDGQYERITASYNTEQTTAFPAAYVHFIEWRYLVQQSRFNEGRATLRIRFILNELDTHSPGQDTKVYYVAERIHQTIQDMRKNYECLHERCSLNYVDPAESFDSSLQPCWMTYEIWFKQRNVWITRRKIYKKFVCPPFTNHADQKGNDPNNLNHSNLDHKAKYDDHSRYAHREDFPLKTPDNQDDIN